MGKAATGFRYRRVVAKAGTNVLTGGGARLDLEALASLVGQVACLRGGGVEVVLVTSGAVAAGRHVLQAPGQALFDTPAPRPGPGPGARPSHRREEPVEARGGVSRRRDTRDEPGATVQALAAVGQSRLMHAYEQLFGWHDLTVAQVLLTRRDVTDRLGYLNIRNTFTSLLDMGVVPIVNENDVVSAEELGGDTFGDNDHLSALVANLADADLLAMLTDTEGLYSGDPHQDPEARLLRRVERVDAGVEALAGEQHDSRSRGGMVTKLQAARVAMASGICAAVAHGRSPGVLVRLARGEEVGTFFAGSESRLESRKRWMLGALAEESAVEVDAGAVRALRQQHGSLLPAGVVGVRGAFERGDVVPILEPGGRRVACGIVNYPAGDVQRIKGQRSDSISDTLGETYGEEVVHRNNLVVL